MSDYDYNEYSDNTKYGIRVIVQQNNEIIELNK